MNTAYPGSALTVPLSVAVGTDVHSLGSLAASIDPTVLPADIFGNNTAWFLQSNDGTGNPQFMQFGKNEVVGNVADIDWQPFSANLVGGVVPTGYPLLSRTGGMVVNVDPSAIFATMLFGQNFSPRYNVPGPRKDARTVTHKLYVYRMDSAGTITQYVSTPFIFDNYAGPTIMDNWRGIIQDDFTVSYYYDLTGYAGTPVSLYAVIGGVNTLITVLTNNTSGTYDVSNTAFTPGQLQLSAMQASFAPPPGTALPIYVSTTAIDFSNFRLEARVTHTNGYNGVAYEQVCSVLPMIDYRPNTNEHSIRTLFNAPSHLL